MSNLFDWSQSILGVQNPEEQMARYADEQQRQNRAAIGYDPNNPSAVAAPAAAPDANAAAQAPSTLPPNQIPNAVKSDPSMGRMIVDLQRYNERKQTFDSSLGGIFATLSQPRNREMMSHAFDVNLPDPAKFGESIMAVSSQQQGQDRANQIGKLVNDPVQGPLLAQKLGMDWGTLKAGVLTDPGMLGKIATVLGTPTQGQRDLAAAQAAIEKQVRLEHPDWTDAQVQTEVNRQAPPSMLLSGVGNLDDQAYRRYAADEQAAGRTPLDPVAWKEHTKNITETRDEAVKDYPTINTKLQRSEMTVNNLLNDIDHTMSAINEPSWRTSGEQLKYMPNWMQADQKTKDQFGQLQTLLSELKGSALTDVKNVRNRQEFNVLGDALTAALQPGQSKEAVQTALNNLKIKFATTRAIAREQAGMSPEEAPQPESSSSGEGKQLSDDDRKQAQELIKRDGRDTVIKHLKANGYDTSGL